MDTLIGSNLLSGSLSNVFDHHEPAHVHIEEDVDLA